MMYRWFIALIIIGGITFTAQPFLDDFPKSWSLQIGFYLQTRLESKKNNGSLQIEHEEIYYFNLVRQFYAINYFQPVWINNKKKRSPADILIWRLQMAYQEGLKPEEYHLNQILALRPSRHPEKVAALEILLTDAFFCYARHLAKGWVDPRTLSYVKLEPLPDLDLLTLLNEALLTDRVEEVLLNLEPKQPGYACLKKALKAYRNQTNILGGKKIGLDPLLRKDSRDQDRVPPLRQRLQCQGDLAMTEGEDEDVFTESVENALKRFQTRHGLPGTGILDAETLRWLNQPWDEYIRMLELNMERWRWLPVDLGERYVLVNIPAFQLQVIEKGRVVITMKVVVGQKYYRTPIFSNKIQYLILNPSWEIPPDILLRDKWYGICTDPNYFIKHHIRVFKEPSGQEVDPKTIHWKKVPVASFYRHLRMRQSADPSNPLGRIKFIFPNDFEVYLHDTSKPELFEKEERDFSSGCIRLEKPVDLAAYILRGHRFWTRERIESAIQGTIEQKIRLTRPLPIYILYLTAWAEPDGTLQFRRDLYGRDRSLERAFQQRFNPEP